MNIREIFNIFSFNFIFFIFSSIINNIFKYGITIFLAIYFLPNDLAIYQKQLLVITYIQFLFFGVSNYLNREIPKLEKESKQQQINLLISSIYAYRNFLLFILIVISIISLIINNYRLSIYIISALLSLFVSLQFTMYRGFDNFYKLSYFLLFFNIVFSSFVYIGCQSKNIDIVLVAYIFSSIITLVFFEYKDFFISFKNLKIRKKVLIHMMVRGKFLAINGLLFSFLLNIDKLLLAFFYTDTELGLYTFINSFTSFMVLITIMISQYYFPKIIKMTNKQKKTIFKKLRVTILIINIFYIIGIYLILPVIINSYFINYIISLKYLSYSIIISSLISIVGYLGLYFNSYYKEKIYTKILIYMVTIIMIFSSLNSLLLYNTSFSILYIMIIVLIVSLLYVLLNIRINNEF